MSFAFSTAATYGSVFRYRYECRNLKLYISWPFSLTVSYCPIQRPPSLPTNLLASPPATITTVHPSALLTMLLILPILSPSMAAHLSKTALTPMPPAWSHTLTSSIGALHFTVDKTSKLTTLAITTAFDKGGMSCIVRVLFPFSDIELRMEDSDCNRPPHYPQLIFANAGARAWGICTREGWNSAKSWKGIYVGCWTGGYNDPSINGIET
jgi:hypothetical protein